VCDTKGDVLNMGDGCSTVEMATVSDGPTTNAPQDEVERIAAVTANETRIFSVILPSRNVLTRTRHTFVSKIRPFPATRACFSSHALFYSFPFVRLFPSLFSPPPSFSPTPSSTPALAVPSLPTLPFHVF
jgi:hypothetical protein